jgi:hypothetical protein
MGTHNGSPRRRMNPSVEAMEARELPSTVAPMAIGHRHGRAVSSAAAPVGTVTGMLAQRVPARHSFFAAFTGPFTIGRGQSQSERLRTFLKGNGTSNRFLKGNLKLALSTPADPTRPISGTATLFDQNYPQTGNQLVLDLIGPPSVDGRPPVLSWKVGDGSSGAFTNTVGEGTLELRFHPGGDRPRPALVAGNAGVQFRGRLVSDRTVNSRSVMEGLGLPH